MEQSKTAQKLDYLTVLSRGDTVTNKALIKNSDDLLVDAISECCLQIVDGSVKIEHEYARKKLQRLKPVLLQLAKKSCSRGKKRRLLMGRGLRILELCLPASLDFFFSLI